MLAKTKAGKKDNWNLFNKNHIGLGDYPSNHNGENFHIPDIVSISYTISISSPGDYMTFGVEWTHKIHATLRLYIPHLLIP